MALGGNGFISVRFQVAGQREVVQRLATFGTRIDSLAPAWEQVGEDLLQDFTAQFDAEGGSFGKFSRWAPLAQSTIVDRLRHGYGPGPILERTGQLRQSVTERMAPGNIFLVGANDLTVGTYTPYAAYHQDGTVKMPPRPVIGLSYQRRSLVVRRLFEYVLDQARAAGLNARSAGDGEGEA